MKCVFCNEHEAAHREPYSPTLIACDQCAFEQWGVGVCECGEHVGDMLYFDETNQRVMCIECGRLAHGGKVNTPIQENMYVWYQDIGYEVLEIRNGIAHIEELDGSSMRRNYIPGIDDIWVNVEQLTPFTEEEIEEWV